MASHQSDDEKNYPTAQIRLNDSSRRWQTARLPVIITVIAVTIAVLVVQMNSQESGAQPSGNGSGSAAGSATPPPVPVNTLPLVLQPGTNGTCMANGQSVQCAAATPPAPTTQVDTDSDDDGILDADDQCVDEPEDKDGWYDEDGCAEDTPEEQRFVKLEKDMKGQSGQWNAIARIDRKNAEQDLRLNALEAWRNQSMQGGGHKSQQVIQDVEVTTVDGKALTPGQQQKISEIMADDTLK